MKDPNKNKNLEDKCDKDDRSRWRRCKDDPWTEYNLDKPEETRFYVGGDREYVYDHELDCHDQYNKFNRDNGDVYFD